MFKKKNIYIYTYGFEPAISWNREIPAKKKKHGKPSSASLNLVSASLWRSFISLLQGFFHGLTMAWYSNVRHPVPQEANHKAGSLHLSQGRSTPCIGDGKPPTFNRESENPYNGYINPYYKVDEFIPYYMETMGVDRPDRTCGGFASLQNLKISCKSEDQSSNAHPNWWNF